MAQIGPSQERTETKLGTLERARGHVARFQWYSRHIKKELELYYIVLSLLPIRV